MRKAPVVSHGGFFRSPGQLNFFNNSSLHIPPNYTSARDPQKHRADPQSRTNTLRRCSHLHRHCAFNNQSYYIPSTSSNLASALTRFRCDRIRHCRNRSRPRTYFLTPPQRGRHRNCTFLYRNFPRQYQPIHKPHRRLRIRHRSSSRDPPAISAAISSLGAMVSRRSNQKTFSTEIIFSKKSTTNSIYLLRCVLFVAQLVER